MRDPFVEVAAALNAAGVRYLLIGVWATNYYARGPVISRLLTSPFLLVIWLLAQVHAQNAPAPLVRDVRGVVQGAGTERVRVTLWHNDMHKGSVEPLAEQLADPDGAFEFAAVPWFGRQQWGFHSFVLIAKSDKLVGALTMRGDKLAPTELHIDLSQATTIGGVLRSQDDRRPIGNVQVWARILGDVKHPIWLTSPLPPWTAVTDAQGRFEIKGLPSLAPVHLMAESPEFARTSILVEKPAEQVAAELALGGKVRGRVLMPDGRPAARVRVRTTGRGAGYGETMTANDGTFCLSGLAADEYKIWAEVDDLTVVAVLGLNVQPGVELSGHTVQLVGGGFIVGRIFDKATGKPFVPGPDADVAMYGPARGIGGSCEVTPVMPDGTFRIRAPAGRNRIYLRSAGGYAEPSEFVDVVEGAETEFEWRLSRPARKQ